MSKLHSWNQSYQLCDFVKRSSGNFPDSRGNLKAASGKTIDFLRSLNERGWHQCILATTWCNCMTPGHVLNKQLSPPQSQSTLVVCATVKQQGKSQKTGEKSAFACLNIFRLLTPIICKWRTVNQPVMLSGNINKLLWWPIPTPLQRSWQRNLSEPAAEQG